MTLVRPPSTSTQSSLVHSKSLVWIFCPPDATANGPWSARPLQLLDDKTNPNRRRNSTSPTSSAATRARQGKLMRGLYWFLRDRTSSLHRILHLVAHVLHNHIHQKARAQAFASILSTRRNSTAELSITFLGLFRGQSNNHWMASGIGDTSSGSHEARRFVGGQPIAGSGRGHRGVTALMCKT